MGMPVLTPGPTTRIGASTQRAARRSHSRISVGTVEARQMPSTASRSSIPPRSTPSAAPAEAPAELAARPVPPRAPPPVVRQPLAVVETEDGLGVADIDSEQHPGS